MIPCLGDRPKKISDTQILMTGGYKNTGLAIPDTYYHDFTTATWTQGPNLKRGRSHHGCALVGGTIPVVAGGNVNLGGPSDGTDESDTVEILLSGNTIIFKE